MAITVPCWILADGRSENWGESEASAIVKFRCLWDDRIQLIKELRGTTRRVGTQIVRVPPLVYADSPNLACVSIDDVSPMGRGFMPFSGWLARKYAIVTARFGVLPFDTTGAKNGQPYTSISFGVAGEFQTLPGTTYRFADGKPTNTPIGRIVVQIEISVTRYMLPDLPVMQCATLAGTVNAAPYVIGDYAFAAGRLLFGGGASQLDADSEGNLTDQVTYKFSYRAVPWNFFLYPSRTGGYQAVTDGSGGFVYPPGDFTILP